MKVQAHSSIEPPMEYNQNLMPMMNQDSLYLFKHFGSYGNIMQFLISSGRENRQRDTRAIKIRVLEKIFSQYLNFIRCRRQHLWSVE